MLRNRHRGNLANWGYSALDRIDRDNVNQLDLAIAFNVRMTPGRTEVGRLEAVSLRTAETKWLFEEGPGLCSTLATARRGSLRLQSPSRRWVLRVGS